MLQVALVACVFSLLVPAHAAKDSKTARELIETALEELRALEKAAYGLDGWLTQIAANLDSSRFDVSQSSSYRDMRRAADGLSTVGTQVQALASKCAQDQKKAGSEFRALTRRLQSSVRSVSNATSVSFAQMGTSRVTQDAAEVRQALGSLSEIDRCEELAEEKKDE